MADPALAEARAAVIRRRSIHGARRDRIAKTRGVAIAVATAFAVATALATAPAPATAPLSVEQSAGGAPSGFSVRVADAARDLDDSGGLPERANAVFLPFATPGGILRRLSPLRVSVPPGWIDGPRSVEISMINPQPGAVLRYTLDGRPPSETHGVVYAGPIHLAGSAVLRAAAFHPQFLTSAILTATYLDIEEVIRQPPLPEGFPATWGRFPEGPQEGEPVPAVYGMDSRIVFEDPESSATIRDGLRAIPIISVVMDPEDLFGVQPGVLGIYSHPLEKGTFIDPATGHKVRPWERTASVEWLAQDGVQGFQVDAGIRIAGRWSRKPDGMAKHSFSLRFRGDYGPTKLRFPVFGADGPDRFDSLRLRAGQADSFLYFPGQAQYVHDEWGRRSQAAMGWPAARGRWVHLYLNGLYWGLYNLTEELDADFASANSGGRAEDWDVIEPGTGSDLESWRVEDGAAGAFSELAALRRVGEAAGQPPDKATMSLVSALLDLPQHADYILLEMFGDNWDWPHNNWVAMRSRVLGGGFRFFVWDYEQVLPLRKGTDGVCGPCNDKPSVATCGTVRCGERLETPGVMALHRWLSTSPEYRFLFADRARRHLFDDGALTPGAAALRYATAAAEVEAPLVAESARWGHAPFGERTKNENWRFVRPFVDVTRTVEDHWRPRRDHILSEFFPSRTAQVVLQLCEAGYYPPVASPKVTVAAPALHVPAGLRVHLGLLDDGCPGQATEGTIWYTLDGTDPREAWSRGVEWGGAVNILTGRPYRGPFHVPADRLTRLKARLYTPDGRWSAATEAVFGTPRLAIDEIMYHPAEDDPEELTEFVEIVNLEETAADLSGIRLSGGVSYTFGAGTDLDAGGRVVIARDAAAFEGRYPGVRPHGEFRGRLSNGGERLTLNDPNGLEIFSVLYSDGDFWPLMPDGRGRSLVLRVGEHPEQEVEPDHPDSWRASSRPGGSPGAADPVPSIHGGVVINEVLANSDSPYTDAIELHLPADAVGADISGWFLSDDLSAPRKYRIPDGTRLEPGLFAAFYEPDLRAGAGPDGGFALGSGGEQVVLMSADPEGVPSGYLTRVRFGATRDNVSLGRVPHAGGVELSRLVSPTFGVDRPATAAEFVSGVGAPNAPPALGDAILNEIHHSPLESAPAFLELYNRFSEVIALGGGPVGGDGAVPEGGPWALIDGVRYGFPEGAELAPGEVALVTEWDPARARSVFGLGPEVGVYGPWSGKLDAEEGERVTLARAADARAPDLDAGGLDGWVVMDSVRYGLRRPWPSVAPSGASLERADADSFGADPASWFALAVGGTPGKLNTRPSVVALPLAISGR